MIRQQQRQPPQQQQEEEIAAPYYYCPIPVGLGTLALVTYLAIRFVRSRARKRVGMATAPSKIAASYLARLLRGQVRIRAAYTAAASTASSRSSSSFHRSNNYKGDSSSPASSHTSRSDSSCYSSSSEDDDDESILAAVSTLFTRAEEDELLLVSKGGVEDDNRNFVYDKNDKSELGQQQQQQPTGKIIARAIPNGEEEYERRKPHDRARDVTSLRKELLAVTAGCCDDDDGFINYYSCRRDEEQQQQQQQQQGFTTSTSMDSVFCLLQADVTLPSFADPRVKHRIQLALHRLPHERAYRSLKRLAISVERKFQQQERLIEEESKRSSSKVHKGDKTGLNVSIWAKKKDAVEAEEDLSAEYARIPLDDSTVCSSLFQSLSEYDECKLHMDLTLRDEVQSLCLPITPFPPTILSVETFEDFSRKVFVGIPLVVDVKAIHAARVIVTWFANEKVVCHDSTSYIPQKDDIGKVLSVLIIPMRPNHDGYGCEDAYEFENKVESLPMMPLVSPLRDSWTLPRNSNDGALRVMSYNLLADLYVTREEDKSCMYNYCPMEFLDRKRRMPMILYEMLAYHPDVICLQEVDHFVFARLLLPALDSQGYQGYYSNKASAQLEGCAMFWSLDMFEKATDTDMQAYKLRDLFGGHHHQDHYDRSDSLEDIDRILGENPELGRVACKKVGQVLQVATLTLRHKGSQCPDKVVVGNTHLFYHPLAGHIRAMQAYAVACQLDTVRRENSSSCPIVLCGDLNSHPLSGAVQLLLQGNLGPEHHETWRHLNDYQWDMGDEQFLLEHGFIGNDADSDPTYEDEEFEDAVESLDDSLFSESQSCLPPHITLPTGFPSLVSGYTKVPEFTNKAIDFAETLDYILASEASPTEPFGFTPLRSAPILNADEMKEYVAMPNEFMPSDHASIICDLQWKRNDDMMMI